MRKGPHTPCSIGPTSREGFKNNCVYANHINMINIVIVDKTPLLRAVDGLNEKKIHQIR